MLTIDPLDRITLDEILAHPWVQGPMLSDVELFVEMQRRTEYLLTTSRNSQAAGRSEDTMTHQVVVTPRKAIQNWKREEEEEAEEAEQSLVAPIAVTSLPTSTVSVSVSVSVPY